MSNRKFKTTTMAKTQHGYQTKVWVDRRTGFMMPTNWKIQAGMLAGPVTITKRLANRAKRRAEAKAAGLSAWKDQQRLAQVTANA